MTITMDAGSSGIDMAADNGVIGSSVSPVSRIAVTRPVTIAISRVAIAVAIGRGISVTIAISGVAITIYG